MRRKGHIHLEAVVAGGVSSVLKAVVPIVPRLAHHSLQLAKGPLLQASMVAVELRKPHIPLGVGSPQKDGENLLGPLA